MNTETLVAQSPAASTAVMPGAEAQMHLTGCYHGVLLLHGFLGSPYEMKYLGNRLVDERYSVYIPRYPGHGTNLMEMTETTGVDWYRAAREAYLELRAHCRQVSIVGLSMGAAFATLLAREFAVSKIALLSMPCRIPQRTVYLAPVVSKFAKVIYRSDEDRENFNRGIYDPEARQNHVGYFDGIPIGPSWELHKIIKRAMSDLEQVHSDVLLIQSRNDDTIPEESLSVIAEGLRFASRDILWLDRSNHAITVDFDREQVADAVTAFLRRYRF